MSDRPLPVQSFVAESNFGGMSMTICACGVLLYRSQRAWLHIDKCPDAIEALAASGEPTP